jgi:ribose transport system ATP-binding protein
MSDPLPLPGRPRFAMRGITKAFGATQALAGVDLAVAAGEVHALVGENGAGKSTLMKVLSGAHPPDAGHMELDGQPYRPRHPLEARQAGVAMIYQELAIAPHLNVAENILLGMEPQRGPLIDGNELHRRARAALAELGLARLDTHQAAGALPIATRQLIEVARAVALGAQVIVLDEPTSSLARGDVERLFALVRRLRQQGRSVVYISHFLEEVQAVCDRYTVLRDGRSVATGTVAGTSTATIVTHMVGRDVKDLYPRSSRTPGEPILEISALAGRSKPTDASLSLRRGEVLGIAGLVGAGRTELLRAIFGLDVVTSGRVRIGIYEGQTDPAGRWAQGVGVLSEDRKTEGLALTRSLAENLTLTKLPRLLRPEALEAATGKWIQRLGIRCRDATQAVGELSGGNQQKVALARLLYHDVDVLLLDEPTRGVDVGAKAEIYRLIDELASRGRAVLMVSSYLPELIGVCDRVAVMCRGRLGPARPVGEVDEHQIMREATGLDAA